MARPKTVNNALVHAEVTINPGSVAANTALEVVATVKGLRVGYPVQVWAPSLEANLVLANAHASDLDELTFRLQNTTAGAIDPASQSFFVVQG